MIDELFTVHHSNITSTYCEKLIQNIDVFKNYIKANGVLGRQGKYNITRKARFLSLNPIQGTLTKFKKQSDYPNKPWEIYRLSEMTEPKLDESGWFRKKNNVYFSFEDG